MSPIPDWAGNVPRETLQRLSDYATLLLKWNRAINLIGRATESELWQRHIWDSYQLVPLVPRETSDLADLGSGGGLPGLVLACALPALPITLIERDIRKATFLREAARQLSLDHITVEASDAAHHTRRYGLVTSRALAPLDELFAYSAPLMKTEAICLFPKGENFATEIAEAQRRWVFDHRVIHSKTNDKAGIVSITNLKPTGMGSTQ